MTGNLSAPAGTVFSAVISAPNRNLRPGAFFSEWIGEEERITGWIILLAACVLAAGAFLFRPLPDIPFRPRLRPARDYAEAVARILAWQAKEAARVLPEARIRFLTHGRRTEQAVVFVHGYTNCPEQFAKFGELVFQAGFNVLIANLPRHGLPDRMTIEHAGLTAEELAEYADETADIARGLGERVTFAGISLGGVVSAWVWASRPDIPSAVLMAPVFGLKPVPAGLTVPAVNLFSALPNFFSWFHPGKRMAGTPDYTYPRFSTRALSQILRMGAAARRRAERNPPAGKELLLIVNPRDWAVNNSLACRIVDRWRCLGASVAIRRLDESWELEHDFVDPGQPGQPIGRVYPLLLEWMGGRKTPAPSAEG
ncbi:MAG: alpha/beta hydrolase [Anaerolineales bacterium]|nr:alpha/beta hydrolase [Anaerolineales bacterium]